MLAVKSQLEIKLLSYFFLNVDKKLYLHEISRLLKVNVANLDKKLKELEKGGVFKSELRGNQRHYSLNKKFPLFQEYQGIINKTFGIENQLKISLKKVKKIDQIFIFGSYTKGKFDEWSDIDVLVVGEHDALSLSKVITQLETRFARNINVIEMTPHEFSRKRKNRDPLLQEIFSHTYIQVL